MSGSDLNQMGSKREVSSKTVTQWARQIQDTGGAAVGRRDQSSPCSPQMGSSSSCPTGGGHGSSVRSFISMSAKSERMMQTVKDREKMVRNRDNWEKRDNPPMSVFTHCLSGRKCNVRADSTSNYHFNPINLITNTYIHTQTGAIAMY